MCRSTSSGCYHNPPDPSNTYLMSCFLREKTDGTGLIICCPSCTNSLVFKAQSPILLVNGMIPLTLPSKKNPPAALTLASSQLFDSVWLPEIMTALERLVEQQTQALHSPMLAMTIQLSETSASTMEQPEAGYDSKLGGSPCFSLMAEHLGACFLSQLSSVSNMFQSAGLYCSILTRSLLPNSSGIIWFASSATSGPAWPSITQNTLTLLLIVAWPVWSSIWCCHPQTAASAQLRSGKLS